MPKIHEIPTMTDHRVRLYLLLAKPVSYYYLLDFCPSSESSGSSSHWGNVYGMPLEKYPCLDDAKLLMQKRTELEVRVAMQTLETLNDEVNMPPGFSYLVEGFASVGAGFQLALKKQSERISTNDNHPVGMREYLLTVLHHPDYVEIEQEKAEQSELQEKDTIIISRGTSTISKGDKRKRAFILREVYRQIHRIASGGR